MRDPEGRTFVWFASKKIADEGETVNLKASIIKHDEYNGRKQTIISRCTKIE